MGRSRRDFVKLTAAGGAAVFTGQVLGEQTHPDETVQILDPKSAHKPIVLSTWNHGLAANKAAWEVLSSGGAALDAVEKGVRVSESDPECTSVGLGGLPDRDGNVTLDACIMNHKNQCGSVAFLQHIENPISVARKVLEDTPHVILAGSGALEFALSKGFVKTNLLTEKSKLAWQEWLKTAQYEPVINRENHDTIGMIALDAEGNLSGACTTSGLAYKMHGRVGDSPIIGAGLFVDNEVGAACATGVGEAVLRISGSAVIVEMMRNGMAPGDACKTAVERIIKIHPDVSKMQVGFIALNKSGEVGCYSIHKGFNIAWRDSHIDKMVDAPYKLE